MHEGMFPSIEELKSVEIARFKEAVARGNGEPIPLNPEVLERPKYLFSTTHQPPFEDFSDYAHEKFKTLGIDKVMFLSIHEQPEPISEPIGFADIQSFEDFARFSSLHHNYNPIYEFIKKNFRQVSRENVEVTNWMSWVPLALCVDPVYRRRGVGSLLTAASLVVMRENDILTFDTGRVVSEDARNMWSSFGITNDMHHTPLLVEDYVNHPRVNSTIARFV